MSDDESFRAAVGPSYRADAEKQVLGAMMAKNDVIDVAVERLKAEDFFVPAHQIIFAVIAEMHDKRTPIDMISVHNVLTDKHQAESVGSPGILAEIAADLATWLNVGGHIATVREHARRRRFADACSAGIQAVLKDCKDALPSADELMKAIEPVITDGSKRQTPPYKVALNELRDELVSAKPRLLVGLDTSISGLNAKTTGWRPGQLIILGARPAVGKTALILQMMKCTANRFYDEDRNEYRYPGKDVGFCSLEMTQAESLERLLASTSKVPLDDIRARSLNPAQIAKIEEARNVMEDWPLHIDDQCCNLARLRSKFRYWKDRYDIAIGFIDYLQLVQLETVKGQNKASAFGEVSHGVKSLAKELGIPIVALSSLNRNNEKDDRPPAMHDLRESGDFESDADIVLLLHKDEYGQHHLNVAKHRGGETGVIKLIFKGATMTFEQGTVIRN